MTKAELEKKHLAELHALAAEAGVERYRMLPRAELIGKLADGDSGKGGSSSSSSSSSSREPAPSRRSASGGDSEQRERPPRRRRSRGGRKPSSGSGDGDREGRGGREPRSEGRGEREPRGGREPRGNREPRSEPKPEPAREPEPAPVEPASSAAASESSARPRRRRRRRFGRRGKQGVTLQGLLLPPEAGRQAVVAAETREACTALLRGIAADLSDDDKGPDPVVLLIDPTPEELADWRRDAPQAEIVAAGQPRHADDALAQAVARASSGDDVLLLVDSLTRLGDAYDDADAAKKFFDAGRTSTGSGTLTVVAALERPASS
jgi:hypothetical protein